MKSHPDISIRRVIRKKAFTLVELLVVISIIALLLAVLMPALQKARELAIRVKCTANLHEQGIALSAYGAVYNRFPPGVQPTYNADGSTSGGCWPFGGMGYLPPNTPAPATGIWHPAGQAALLKGKFLLDPKFLYCPGANKYHITYNSVFTVYQKNPAINPWWPNDLRYDNLWIGYPYWVSWVPRGKAGMPADYSPQKTVAELNITSQGITSRGNTVAISDLTMTLPPPGGNLNNIDSVSIWVNHVRHGGFILGGEIKGGKISGSNTLYNDGSAKWVPFSDMKKDTKKHLSRDDGLPYYYWF